MKYFRFFFLFFFIRDVSWEELLIISKIILSSFFLRNIPKNQRKIAKYINQLGIVPTKLAQWMGYFLRIQFESYSYFHLFLDSLPYLQNQCNFVKPHNLEEFIKKYNHIIDSLENQRCLCQYS